MEKGSGSEGIHWISDNILLFVFWLLTLNEYDLFLYLQYISN